MNISRLFFPHQKIFVYLHTSSVFGTYIEYIITNVVCVTVTHRYMHDEEEKELHDTEEEGHDGELLDDDLLDDALLDEDTPIDDELGGVVDDEDEADLDLFGDDRDQNY